ncbi:hypothetical protein LCGC14_1748500, partial [marine sediment metagenome]
KGDMVIVSGRQCGKSLIASIKACDFALKHPNTTTMIVSVTAPQSEEMLLKCLNRLETAHPKKIDKKTKHKPTKSMIRLTNGSIIRCKPVGVSGTGIRGYTVHLLIADEAAHMPEECWQAIEPTLLTTAGTMILVSTPWGKKGYFYDAYISGDFKTFHVNSLEVMKTREFSDSWTQIQQTKAIERINRNRERWSELKFRQEYMGEFLDDLLQFFSDNLIKECQTLKRKPIIPDRTYYLGIDVARMGRDASTFEIFIKLENGHVAQVENIVTTKTLLHETTDRIIELNRQYNFKKIYIDDGGFGVAVFDYLLKEPTTRNKVEAINNSSRALDKDGNRSKRILKEDLYMNTLRLMEQGKVRFLDDENLFFSFKCIQTEISEETRKLKISGDDSHIVEGVIRALWAAQGKNLSIWIDYV